MASTVFDIKKKRSIKSKNIFQLEDFANLNSTLLFGSFGERIRCFLDSFAEIEDYTVNGMPIWSTFLVTKNDGVLALYTVEETVQYSTLNIHFCNHCKLSGWGHHFVSKKKYHLIISVNEDMNEPLKENFAQVRSHCLYGLIHCNGYGHLICVNGLKNNSNLFTATDAMGFWNNLCTFLKTRKISVRDVLRKGSVELRLIHGVAYGESWFEKWGYIFSGGSSGLTEQKYDKAIRFLSSLRLSKIVCDFKNKRNGRKIKQMVDKYQELSEMPLVTTSDLLQFMLAAESRNVVQISNKAYSLVSEKTDSLMGFEEFVDSMAEGDCRWSAKRLENVLIVIVSLLKDHKCDMSRHELREEARKYIGDTGLIDFVLKSIKCFQVENYIIRRVINPSTKVAEFTIDEVFKERKSIKWPISKPDCKWSQDKLENAAKVVVTILSENQKNNTMPRQELLDKAKVHIHDKDLIDFVLNSLDNSRIGNQTVYRTKNPITKRIEFAVAENYENSIDNLIDMNLHQDVLFLYKNVLLGYPEMNSVSLGTRIILESKQFVKEWPIDGEAVNQLMAVACKVLPSFDELETELNRPLPPGVVVEVPPWISIGDLKVVVQCALRETYCVMDEFVVSQIGGLRSVEDDKMLSCVVEPGGCVWVRGWGLDLVTELRYEDGPGLEIFVHG